MRNERSAISNQSKSNMKTLFENIFFKLGMITVLIILLLIPAIMVQDLIRERTFRSHEATIEVSGKHASDQVICGPVITIPVIKHNYSTDVNGKTTDHRQKEYYHFLPETLNIDGKVNPQKRKRGIFEVIVYGSDLDINGTFKTPNLEDENIPKEDILYNDAFVTVGISDLKGVTEQVRMKMYDSVYQFNPGVISKDVVESGLNIRIPIDSTKEQIKFDFNLNLNGSESLMFVPIGKVSDVRLSSKWQEPSFDGNFLPKERTVNKDGFKSHWKVLHLNRNFPQQWKGARNIVHQSEFGVNLKLPVDVYQKSMRVAKYAILFVTLTFLVFFFVEVLNKILIHPIQYILVGIALILFYVLLLAFSEQIYFDYAYLLAAFMTISLILVYCKAILKSWWLSIMTATILTILYLFIFVIIQMQDYALLVGSLGVFFILAVTMYFSRKIDWFEITQKKEEEPIKVIE